MSTNMSLFIYRSRRKTERQKDGERTKETTMKEKGKRKMK